MLMITYIHMYVSMSLYDRVFKDRSCGGMIANASEWYEDVPGL